MGRVEQGAAYPGHAYRGVLLRLSAEVLNTGAATVEPLPLDDVVHDIAGFTAHGLGIGRIVVPPDLGGYYSGAASLTLSPGSSNGLDWGAAGVWTPSVYVVRDPDLVYEVPGEGYASIATANLPAPPADTANWRATIVARVPPMELAAGDQLYAALWVVTGQYARLIQASLELHRIARDASNLG